MAEVTVKQLADVVGTPVETLLTQMKDAGLKLEGPESVVSDEEKQALLAHLKRAHGEDGKEEGGTKKITLKRRSTSTLKATGSTGRSKTVNVEVRKKRTYVKRSVLDEEEKKKQEAEEAVRAEEQRVAEAEEAKAKAESEAKAKSEAEGKVKADKVKAEVAAEKKAEAAKKAKAEEAARRKKETPKEREERETREAKQKIADDARAKAEEAARKEAEEEAVRKTAEEAARLAKELEERKPEEKVVEVVETGIVADAFEESIERESRGVRRKRRKPAAKVQHGNLKSSGAHGFEKPTKKEIHDVEVGETIPVADLAQQLKMKSRDIVKTLMKMGEMVSVDQAIDQETATLLVEELGHNVVAVKGHAEKMEDSLTATIERDGDHETRAPVVTIMGHVDHGKTSLLDYIRKAKVADGEAGGITQHIGAYHVETEKGAITFLDTPGHAAFTAMRARGADATDIVIIVVAADDGVMPQTEEAINHAKAAGVPIIIAVNKIDKEAADMDRVKNEMAAKDVIPEDWGGEIQFIGVSAHTGEGVDSLLEAVLLQSELLELTAVKDGSAEGVVIESRLDKGRGAVASILVQQGTLRQGDMVLVGPYYGRVKAMVNEHGKKIKEAGPSLPVEILGLGGAPDAGTPFLTVPDERKAREVALFRDKREREERMERQHAGKLENMFANMGKAEVSNLSIVLKADVRGSLEALMGALSDLNTDEVQVNIVASGVGAITESDVNLALTSGAAILGFNVRADSAAKRACQEESVDLRYYAIIYELIDDVKDAMSGLLSPERREEILGVAEVREVHRSSKFGVAAGCMVIEGTLHRSKRIRVLRDDVVVYEGELESLRRFKDDVEEVRNGVECGVAVKGYNDVKSGDKIEVYQVTEIARSL